ncbi:MAG: hypothetical protein J0L97_07605 [Alphaproteobacteria bacterium]|nr:hypothetical protein [Alphaproteobacteria bacterium]
MAGAPGAQEDWRNLNHVLTLRGVPAVNIDWITVDRRCGGEKGDVEAYNRCRYGQIMEQKGFEGDRRRCRNEASVHYPDTLALMSHDRAYDVYDAHGRRVRTVVEREPPISYRRLQDLRESYQVECMHGTGWKSHRDWTVGKK